MIKYCIISLKQLIEVYFLFMLYKFIQLDCLFNVLLKIENLE